jgi:exodeoxyribonuclease-3
MPLTIATWNVNSIRARLDHVSTWIADHEPDVLCLQETKVEDKVFPKVPFLELGYTVTLHGGRALCGVATISKRPPTEVVMGFRDEPADKFPRILECVVDGIRIFNLYAPNGTQVGSEAFTYKLEWFERLRAQLDRHCRAEDPILLVGDFNVAPDERDVWDPAYMAGRLQFTPDEHRVLGELCGFGLHDGFRKHTAEGGHYTWFDYRTNGFARNEGLRIDLALASRGLVDRVVAVKHDHVPRSWDVPSDHAPVVVTLASP